MDVTINFFASDGFTNRDFQTGGSIRSRDLYEFYSSFCKVNLFEPNSQSNNSYQVTYESQYDIIKKNPSSYNIFCNTLSCCLESYEHNICFDVHGPIFIESAFFLNSSIQDKFNEFYKKIAFAKFITFVNHEQNVAVNFLGLNSNKNSFFKKNTFTIPPKITKPRFSKTTSDKYILYMGSQYPWLDPFLQLKEISQYLSKELYLKIFTGVNNIAFFNPNIEKNLKLLKNQKYVEVNPLIPHSELNPYIFNAFAALDISSFSPERTSCFSTRSLELVSCGIPVVVNEFSFLGRVFNQDSSAKLVISKSNSLKKIVSFLNECDYEDKKQLATTQYKLLESYLIRYNEGTLLRENFF